MNNINQIFTWFYPDLDHPEFSVLLPSANEVCEGNVFTGVTPPGRHPLWAPIGRRDTQIVMVQIKLI